MGRGTLATAAVLAIFALRCGGSGATLSAIDLRFEQHCEGGGAALRGQIHWTAAP